MAMERLNAFIIGLVRYLSLLVTKELVLHNFSGVQPNLLLERMVEVTSALQKKL